LPVYYQFRFHTSDEGDFESLVRRLTPQKLPATVGQLPLDVSHPGPGLPPAGTSLQLEGALESLACKPTSWAGPQKDAFQAALQTWINQTDPPTDDPNSPNVAGPNHGDPIVVPPIYGRWHAGVLSVDRTAPGWLNDLGLDPRYRSAAGMGTQIVQGERIALLASAWQQVAGVQQANQMLKQAQLARAVSQQLYRQHFVPAQPETLLNLTAPLEDRILATTITVKAVLRASRVPERMLSGSFRKLARLPWRLRIARDGPATLLGRVNSGAVWIVPPLTPPGGMVAMDQFSGPAGPFQVSSFTAQTIAKVPPQAGFEETAEGVPSTDDRKGPRDSEQGAAFRTAAEQLFADLQVSPTDPAPLPALDLATLCSTILSRIDPVTTVPRRAHALISLPAQIPWAPADPLEPIMAAPEFPQPMYVPLQYPSPASPAYLLPGADQVLPNSMGLLQANRRFIEAYMVGLNHEMARQLLWNGYPTDQRGSYFRQFWDVSAYVPQASDPTDPQKLHELLKDIPPINTWPLPVALGQHPNRTDITANNLVLLVRGELFKRYPNAIVYAGKAKKAADGKTLVLDDTDERYPIFGGTLPPDMTFLGFNLTRDQAAGQNPESDGYFFVFQEPPLEPRFGLEPYQGSAAPVAHWADLAWTNFATGATSGPAFQVPDLVDTSRGRTLLNNRWRLASLVFGLVQQSVSLPDFLSPQTPPVSVALAAGGGHPADPDYTPEDPNNNWGVNSAQTAYILFRVPFRILIQAKQLLPLS
jgi:hypothetical protein